MARSRKHEPVTIARTRTKTAWFLVAFAIVFLILLIDFIVQNEQKISIHFLGLSGHVSGAVALVIAALAGAVLVLLVGTGRIVQLRLTVRRYNRAKNRGSAAGAPPGEAQAVEPEDKS